MEVSTRAVIPFKMTPSRKRLISWADGFRGLRIGDVTALNGNVPAIKSGKHLPLFDHHTTKSLFFGIPMGVINHSGGRNNRRLKRCTSICFVTPIPRSGRDCECSSFSCSPSYTQAAADSSRRLGDVVHRVDRSSDRRVPSQPYREVPFGFRGSEVVQRVSVSFAVFGCVEVCRLLLHASPVSIDD